MTITKLNSIQINKFRALESITIPIADRITVICGKNGTSKSSVLGIAAQAFSFRKDPESGDVLKYGSLIETRFESLPSEHFRISKQYDTTGSVDVLVNWFDGYTDDNHSLTLRFYNYRDRPYPRAVARENTSVLGRATNTSIKATHPVVYLSLKRLMPIALRSQYITRESDFFNNNKDVFIDLCREILGKVTISAATETTGTISSASPHAANYDHFGVSSGEDNVGQIALALMSFKKLKEEYKSYKGGLLLIDEADAGLFPGAQLSLVKVLSRYCSDLDIQVIMTSHSPIIIEEVYRLSSLSQKNSRHYATIYLTDSYGPIQFRKDLSWTEIQADLRQETVEVLPDLSLPKINVYFEDREGCDFFDSLVRKRAIRSCISLINNVSMGAKNYIDLIRNKVPEFCTKSIVILDGDQSQAVAKIRSKHHVVLLPTHLPADQLLFQTLWNLPSDHAFWENSQKFTPAIFYKISMQISSKLKISEDQKVDVHDALSRAKLGYGQARDLFKNFYNSKEIQNLLKGKISGNPFYLWTETHKEECLKFREQLQGALINIYVTQYGLSTANLDFLKQVS